VLITHDADVADVAGRTMRIRDGQISSEVLAGSGTSLP
jgi:ABC-type lipoprotein export system ATPase subunit